MDVEEVKKQFEGIKEYLKNAPKMYRDNEYLDLAKISMSLKNASSRISEVRGKRNYKDDELAVLQAVIDEALDCAYCTIGVKENGREI